MHSLVVEDDFIARSILLGCLSPYGACDAASSGEEAIAAVERSFANGVRYDLIVLDVMLPGASGGAVLKSIREMERSRDLDGAARAKVVMMTGLDGATSRKAAEKWGCDAYMTKPIEPLTLQMRLRDLGVIE